MGVSTSSLILMRQIGGNSFIAIFTYLFLLKIKKEYINNQFFLEKKIDIFSINNFKNINLNYNDKLIVTEIFDKSFQMIFLYLVIICILIFILSLFGKEKKLSKISHIKKK